MRIWQREGDGDAWKCTAVLEDSHSKTIRTVAWAPTSKQLVTASFDGTSAIWQARGAAWEQVRGSCQQSHVLAASERGSPPSPLGATLHARQLAVASWRRLARLQAV